MCQWTSKSYNLRDKLTLKLNDRTSTDVKKTQIPQFSRGCKVSYSCEKKMKKSMIRDQLSASLTNLSTYILSFLRTQLSSVLPLLNHGLRLANNRTSDITKRAVN